MRHPILPIHFHGPLFRLFLPECAWAGIASCRSYRSPVNIAYYTMIIRTVPLGFVGDIYLNMRMFLIPPLKTCQPQFTCGSGWPLASHIEHIHPFAWLWHFSYDRPGRSEAYLIIHQLNPCALMRGSSVRPPQLARNSRPNKARPLSNQSDLQGTGRIKPIMLSGSSVIFLP